MSTVMNNIRQLPVRPRSVTRRAASERGSPDHDILLAAVAIRLRAAVDGPALPPQALHELVRDCALAIDQLRPSIAQERAYGDRIERELQEARIALAAARQALAGTRDGERRALHLADHDGLTSLPNRNGFQKRLDEALANRGSTSSNAGAAPWLAVLLLDLDDFKPINDRHGPVTGDELLRIVGQRLSRAVRAGDMVCRLGGDEFACLLTAPMGRDQLSHVASKLFDAVSAPLTVGVLELTVRPSIGIVMAPSDGNNAQTLLQHADSAMYRAKRRQLGFSFYDARVDA